MVVAAEARAESERRKAERTGISMEINVATPLRNKPGRVSLSVLCRRVEGYQRVGTFQRMTAKGETYSFPVPCEISYSVCCELCDANEILCDKYYLNSP